MIKRIAIVLPIIFVATFFFFTGSAVAEVINGIYIPGDTNLPEGNVACTLQKIGQWLLGSIGVLAILMISISGVRYLVSGGNDAMTEKAKKTLWFSIAGLAIALASYSIVITIAYFMGADTTSGSSPCGPSSPSFFGWF